MIIDRDRYIDQLSRSKGNGLIKIITGLRRSGKSFLLKKLFRQHLLDEGIKENHILIIDMESRKNKEFKNPDHLLDWVEKMMEDDETYYIIIDEVQEVDDFVEVLSSLSVTDGTDIYVTGSNSRFLSSDVVTEFRGRGDEIHVWPLSFREFMSVYKGTQEEGWAEYRLYGGLPQLLTQIGDDKKADFLRRLYRTVYLRDIYERNRIELQAEFEEVSKTVASSIGAPVNALNIANTFKSVSNVQNITNKTVSAYLEYMQDAFLVEKSERYDIKGRKYIGSLAKYYYQDVGLRNAILSFRQSEPTHIMENAIYNEMRRRRQHLPPGTECGGQTATGDIRGGLCLQQGQRTGIHPICMAFTRCREDGTGETFPVLSERLFPQTADCRRTHQTMERRKRHTDNEHL